MVVTVRVPSWEIEGDGRVFAVGHEISSWLTFDEDGSGRDAADVQLVEGIAVPLPSWPAAELSRHPVRIDLDGAALYWDAPRPVEGPLRVSGTISTNTMDAPDGFPVTVGVVRRVRMEWRDYVAGPDGSWVGGPESTYEEVAVTYVPPPRPGRRIRGLWPTCDVAHVASTGVRFPWHGAFAASASPSRCRVLRDCRLRRARSRRASWAPSSTWRSPAPSARTCCADPTQGISR